MASGLVAVPHRQPDGGLVLQPDGEEAVEHVEADVAVALGTSLVQEPGTLYITNRRLAWLSAESATRGLAVGFLSISLHAISRDPDAFPQPCIYMQIDSDGGPDEEDEEEDEDGPQGGASAGGAELERGAVGGAAAAMMVEAAPTGGAPLASMDGGAEDLARVSEMRLIPRDPDSLERIFKVLCDCAALNPDPAGEQEGEGEFYHDAEAATLNGEDLELDPQRFEDAEDEDDAEEDLQDEAHHL